MLYVKLSLKAMDNLEGPTFLYSMANNPFNWCEKESILQCPTFQPQKNTWGAWFNWTGILLVFLTHLQIESWLPDATEMQMKFLGFNWCEHSPGQMFHKYGTVVQCGIVTSYACQYIYVKIKTNMWIRFLFHVPAKNFHPISFSSVNWLLLACSKTRKPKTKITAHYK